MEMETRPKAKVYAIGVLFRRPSATEFTIRFRIDIHTIKRGSLKTIMVI
jgi:hypothetical protein